MAKRMATKVLVGLCISGLLAATCGAALGQAKGRRGVTAENITDEDVVEAIRAGAKYLLGTKNNDNWEGGNPVKGQHWRRDGHLPLRAAARRAGPAG